MHEDRNPRSSIMYTYFKSTNANNYKNVAFKRHLIFGFKISFLYNHCKQTKVQNIGKTWERQLIRTTKLIRKKPRNLYVISAVVEGQHLVELTAFTYFRFISLVVYTLFLRERPICTTKVQYKMGPLICHEKVLQE